MRLPYDFGEIEIKTKKYEGGEGSLLTLFHKEPKPRASVPKLLKSIGWKHSEAGLKYKDDERSFRSTTWGHRFSDRGMTVVCTDEKIGFVFNPEKVNKETADRTANYATYGEWLNDVDARHILHHKTIFPIYYALEDVQKVFVEKLNHTLLAMRKTKTDANGIKYHWFEEAYLMKEVRTDMIVPLIQEGSMALDFDARTRHNHGTKFRIKKSAAHRLFTDFAILE